MLRNLAVSMNAIARLSNKSCCELNEHLETIVCRKNKLFFMEFWFSVLRKSLDCRQNLTLRNNYAMINRQQKDLKTSKFPYSVISIKFCCLIVI